MCLVLLTSSPAEQISYSTKVKPHEITDRMELFRKTSKQILQPTDSCSIAYSGSSIPPPPSLNTNVEEQNTATKVELVMDTDIEIFQRRKIRIIK